MVRRHDIFTTNHNEGEAYTATCRSCAVGVRVSHGRTVHMWVAAHARRHCAACGHAASSHGSIAAWEYFAERGEGGTACGSCKCMRYAG